MDIRAIRLDGLQAQTRGARVCSMFTGRKHGWGDTGQTVRTRRGYPPFRQSHIRGGRGLSRIGSSLDDSGRIGLRDPRRAEHGQCQGQRWSLPIGFVLALLAAWILAGCRSSAKPDPATIWQNIRSDSIRGNLDVAQQEAEQARKDFSASSADWAMKFRLLEAEILTYQGRWPEVVALLDEPRHPVSRGGRCCHQEKLSLWAGKRQARPRAASR